jgi:hypothetical protein
MWWNPVCDGAEVNDEMSRIAMNAPCSGYRKCRSRNTDQTWTRVVLVQSIVSICASKVNMCCYFSTTASYLQEQQRCTLHAEYNASTRGPQNKHSGRYRVYVRPNQCQKLHLSNMRICLSRDEAIAWTSYARPKGEIVFFWPGSNSTNLQTLHGDVSTGGTNVHCMLTKQYPSRG